MNKPTVEDVIKKWEEKIKPTLAEDAATADLYDLMVAYAIRDLIAEIREAGGGELVEPL